MSTLSKSVGALASLALVFGLLANAPAEAFAADPLVYDEQAVATGPRPTEVLAASGQSLVAKGTGVTQISLDNGQTWETSALQTGAPAAYVADGKAVWVAYKCEKEDDGVVTSWIADSCEGGTVAQRIVAVLDLVANTLADFAVYGNEKLQAVTAGHAILGSTSGWYRKTLADLADFSVLGEEVRFDAKKAEPKGTKKRVDSFVMSDSAAARLTSYYKSTSATALTSYVDIDLARLDPAAPDAVPFRVTGQVPYIGFGGDDGTELQYVQRNGKSVSWCVRAQSASKATCKKIASVKSGDKVSAGLSADAITLTIKNTLKVYELGAKKLRTVKLSGTSAKFFAVGDAERPLAHSYAGTTGTTYKVTLEGTSTALAASLFTDFAGPVPPSSLDLDLVSLAGTDNRDLATGWKRSATAGTLAPASDEALIDPVAKQYQISGQRSAVLNGTTLTRYDGGKLTGTVKKVTSLLDVSGSYALVNAAKKNKVLLPNGKYWGSYSAAIFGSLAVELNSKKTGFKVVDLSQPAKSQLKDSVSSLTVLDPSLSGYKISTAYLYGDRIAFGLVRGSLSLTQLYDTRAQRLYKSCVDTLPVGIGDGFAVLEDLSGAPSFKIWNTDSDTACDDPSLPLLEDADPSVDPAAYGTQVAWVTRIQDNTGKVEHSLRLADVSDLAGVGNAAPRLLSVEAPATLNVNGEYWKPFFDLSTPVEAGTLTISNAAGVAVRTIAVPASAADGSIRTLAVSGQGWDGKADDGTTVPNGKYLWKYQAKDAADKAVKAVDGYYDPTGTITVTNKALPKLSATTAKVSNKKPKVNQTLTAVFTAWKPAGVSYVCDWYRNSTKVASGPCDQTPYLTTQADYGKKIKVKVSGTCPTRAEADEAIALGTIEQAPACTGYKAVAKTSAASAKVAKAPMLAATPVIIDAATAVIGTALAVDLGDGDDHWLPARVTNEKVSYKWYRVNAKGKASAISASKGGTAATYAPVAADVGYRIKVAVKVTATGYTTTTRTTALTGVITA
ncbi:MAG: hypothetical protein LBI99_08485 [Propionibacteriaceae bacterium]|jgi:hypothetical protein|nr:hypothetical protein [Propionibacteriaceae bacterium]